MGVNWLTIFLGQELMNNGAVFSRLIEEYGNRHSENQSTPTKAQPTSPGNGELAANPIEHALMQEEERNTGAVDWRIYKEYLRNSGGLICALVIGALLLINEGNNSKYFCGEDSLFKLMFNSRHHALLGILEWKYDPPLHTGGVYGSLRRPW